MAYAYWTILHGPSDVRDAIDASVLTHFRDAQRIAVMKVAGERSEAIRALGGGQGTNTTDASPKVPEPVIPVKAVHRGRPATGVTLPRVTNPALLHLIAEKLCSKQEFAPYGSLDWTDMKAAGDVVRQIFRRLEKRLKTTESR